VHERDLASALNQPASSCRDGTPSVYERVLFIGAQFRNLYTALDLTHEVAFDTYDWYKS